MLYIQLLGGFRVTYHGTPVAKLQSERLQALLAYLLLHRDRPLSRQQLAVTFWPDTTDAQARTNLRTLLTRLREALPDPDQFLTAGAQTVQWRGDSPSALDVLEFERELASGALTQAVELYRGDLLPGCYDDWIAGERERLRQDYQCALDRLIDQSEQQRRFDQAIAYAQRLLRHDPLHEATYRCLIRLQLASGERFGALRTYHACAKKLRDELGVDPSPETGALYAQLLKFEAYPIETPMAPEPARVAFIGRQAEWAELLTAWRTVTAGRPRLALITGEAGIGKTHFAEHLLAYLDRQSVATAVARCYPTEQGIAYAPVAQWLQSEALRDRLTALDQVWLTEVSRLVPWLQADRPELPAPGPLTEAWQRWRLFEALARAVLIRREPLLLFVDDAHWADRETLDWLHYLLQLEPAAPVLVVGAARQEELSDNEALNTLRLLLQRDERLTEIPLARFDAMETAALASSLAERELRTDEVTSLYRDTEGNPLFVVETIRAGWTAEAHPNAPEGRLGDAALPPKVQAAIQYRLSQLSANAQALIQIAAVIGREFTFEVIAQASDQSEDALVRGLDELWRKQIVREQGASAYDFSHDKIRAVAYAALSAARRRVLHRQVAEALVSVHASSLDAISSQIGRHYEIAGQFDRAIEFLRRAAGAAQRIYAHEEAIQHYNQALAVLQSLPLDVKRAEITTHLKEELGDSYSWIGRFDEARESYHTALNQVPAEESIRRADLHRRIGITWLVQAQVGRAEQEYEVALSLLGAPVETFNAAAWQAWIQIHLNLADVYHRNMRADRLFALVAEIGPIVEQHGTSQDRAALLHVAWLGRANQERFLPSDESLSIVEAALAAWQEVSDLGQVVQGYLSCGFAHLWRDELPEAERNLLESSRIAKSIGRTLLLLPAQMYLSLVARKRGDIARTRDLSEELLAGATQPPALLEEETHRRKRGVAESNLAWIAWRQGQFEVACDLCTVALLHMGADFQFRTLALWPLVGVALRRQRLADAFELLSQIVDPKQHRLPFALETEIEAALAMWSSGDSQASQGQLERVAEIATALGYL